MRSISEMRRMFQYFCNRAGQGTAGSGYSRFAVLVAQVKRPKLRNVDGRVNWTNGGAHRWIFALCATAVVTEYLGGRASVLESRSAEVAVLESFSAFAGVYLC